jgi:O-6-methylguanine DNA methyltransferase
MENSTVIGRFNTPFGEFGAVITSKGLSRLTFPTEPFSFCEEWVKRWIPEAFVVEDKTTMLNISEQLNAYFKGDLRKFQLPLDLRGTPFQLKVWHQLENINFGQTRSYSQIAHLIGSPKAIRAVGAANGANPIPIIIPCHRVIGSSGKLVGYAGGLDLKYSLLILEGVLK